MMTRGIRGGIAGWAVVLGLMPMMAGVARAEESNVKAGKPKYEVIPIDPSRKMKEEPGSKKSSVDVLEQKGLGAPQFPDDARKKPQDDGISLKEICAEYEGKIVSFVDYVSLVEGCKQRRIEDQQLLNDLLVLKKTAIVDIPSSTFRKIPPGLSFRRKDYQAMEKDGGPTRSSLCKENEGRYATTDGEEFFLISDCKLRRVESFQSLVDDSANGKPVLVLAPEVLEQIPKGSEIKSKDKEESSVLYRVDGDVIWSRLYEGKVNRSSEDSLETMKKIELELVSRLDRGEVCKSLEGRVISFFSKLYLVDKCVRRPLEGISLVLQAKIVDAKGISDVTSGQYRMLPEGVPVKEEELKEKFKL
jgi:hypothetical protein